MKLRDRVKELETRVTCLEAKLYKSKKHFSPKTPAAEDLVNAARKLNAIRKGAGVK